jgi:hypothetical protein
VAVACAIARPAFAAPADDAGPTDAKARARLAAGMEKFDAGQFEEAKREFQASFEREKNPLSLWGWAQATNKVDGCRKSVKLYRDFSEMVDEGSEAYDVALEAIAECADELAHDDASTTPVEDDPVVEDDVVDDSDPPQRPWHRDPLGGVLVGLGAAGTATGIGLLAAAAVERNNPCNRYDCFEVQQQKVDNLTIAGAVVVGVGGALLVGGVVRWAVLGARQRGNASAGPLVHPRSIGISIVGRF